MLDLFSPHLGEANAKAFEAGDFFAVDPIAQKVRKAEARVLGATRMLTTLIVQQHAECKALDRLSARKTALEECVGQALATGNFAFALEGVPVVAEMEKEEAVRRDIIARLKEEVAHLRLSVDRTHHRIAMLRQVAATGRVASGAVARKVPRAPADPAEPLRHAAACFSDISESRASEALAALGATHKTTEDQPIVHFHDDLL